VKTVLFAGGGTGGHLMPALAIADAMVKLDPTIEPYFVGALRGVEAKVLPSRPWRHTLLPFEPIYRKQWWKNIRLPVATYRSFTGIRKILKAENPVLAIGTGGYASGPALWAAEARGIPIVLQEQNAYPGFATRRLAGRASQVHLGFPEAESFLRPGADTEVLDTGNPIVPPPRPLPDGVDAKLKWGFSPEQKVVLVTGGSQGSLALNDVLATALASGLWPREVAMIWQAGASTLHRFSALAKPGFVAVEGFIDPMADAYAAADFAIARGGAVTAADLAAWGLPSIIIPLPTSAANHQLTNARALDDAGAAILLEQKDLTPKRLVDTMMSVLNNPAKTADLAAGARERARPDAATEIARHALRLL
jgi:UDP-N-acetylglucosamine--N-acetylmuramyl-(pentapeptide) pyrophosphoryl-undecaprenol N-acetylglucosamine transferase